MEGEGKKVKTGGGFHGKGYKFDESEANFASEKKKFEKAALGLADSDDEDIEQDIDQQIESMLNTKRTVKEIKVVSGVHCLCVQLMILWSFLITCLFSELFKILSHLIWM